MNEIAIKMIRKELERVIERRNLSDPHTAALDNFYYAGQVDAYRLALIILGVDSKELPK